MKLTLIQGDCLEVLPTISNNSIDMVLTDLPYGITQNPYDKKLDLDILFDNFWKILKETGTIVMTSQEPFTSELIMSQKENFKYDIIWDKKRTSGFLNANKMPLRRHENILIFYKKLGTYNIQFTFGEQSHSRGKNLPPKNRNYGKFNPVDNTKVQGKNKYPTSIIEFIKPHPPTHPTEKPVKLFEWLIKTYSNERDTILDCCLGIGTTMSACKNLNRNCIGIEINPEYIEIIKKRLNWGISLSDKTEWEFKDLNPPIPPSAECILEERL